MTHYLKMRQAFGQWVTANNDTQLMKDFKEAFNVQLGWFGKTADQNNDGLVRWR